jgi:hypothetical protein
MKKTGSEKSRDTVPLNKGKSTETVFLGSPQDRKVKSPAITCLFQHKHIDKKSNVLDSGICLEREKLGTPELKSKYRSAQTS